MKNRNVAILSAVLLLVSPQLLWGICPIKRAILFFMFRSLSKV